MNCVVPHSLARRRNFFSPNGASFRRPEQMEHETAALVKQM